MEESMEILDGLEWRIWSIKQFAEPEKIPFHSIACPDAEHLDKQLRV